MHRGTMTRRDYYVLASIESLGSTAREQMGDSEFATRVIRRADACIAAEEATDERTAALEDSVRDAEYLLTKALGVEGPIDADTWRKEVEQWLRANGRSVMALDGGAEVQVGQTIQVDLGSGLQVPIDAISDIVGDAVGKVNLGDGNSDP